MVNKIDISAVQHQNKLQPKPQKARASHDSSFENLLVEKSGEPKLRFSKHAEERLRMRNVELTAREIGDIGDALDRAERKGIRDTLILTDKIALIASAKNKTVITTVPRDELKQNIFTNIDGAVII